MGLVLNIGGQGEIAYAVDINNLVSPTVNPDLFIYSGRLIRADATALPVRSAVADAVKGNRFPAGNDAFRLAVAAEASRVSKPAGVFGSGRPVAAAGSGDRRGYRRIRARYRAGYAEGVRP